VHDKVPEKKGIVRATYHMIGSLFEQEGENVRMQMINNFDTIGPVPKFVFKMMTSKFTTGFVEKINKSYADVAKKN